MNANNKESGEIIPGVTVVEHTSDVGIHVTAPDIDRLMERCARGMTALMVGSDQPCPGVKIINKKMLIDGLDREALLNNFLSELIYLQEGEGLILAGFDSCFFEDGLLYAQAKFQKFDDSCRKVITPIKAVTFHKLKIEKVKGVHQVTIIFDV